MTRLITPFALTHRRPIQEEAHPDSELVMAYLPLKERRPMEKHNGWRLVNWRHLATKKAQDNLHECVARNLNGSGKYTHWAQLPEDPT